jgi:hypothetical protein
MMRILESVGIVIGALLLAPIVLIYVSRLRARMNFDYAMLAVARHAVIRARREQGVELDYSPASIERVEEILGKIRESHLGKPMSDKELSILSARWGAYIGEVMKRIRPGKWRRDSGQAGAGAIPLFLTVAVKRTLVPGPTKELWMDRKITWFSNFRPFRIRSCAIFSV